MREFYEKDSLLPREVSTLCRAAAELGASFVVAQFHPAATTDATVEKIRRFGDTCREAGLDFFINQEITNYSVEGEFLDESGKDVMAQPDGCHRWDLTGTLLERVAGIPNLKGVLYDEAEHGQIRREVNTNLGDDFSSSGRVHPYFAVTDGMTLEEAYEAVYGTAARVAAEYRRKGLQMVTEHVWPIMFHTFARAGIVAAPKFLKESINPVWASIAMGAARQYGTGFWVNVDLWGRDGFATHSVEEFRCALLFAYWLGAERVFVENLSLLWPPDINDGLLVRRVEDEHAVYVPTEYGEVYRWFVKEYVPAHPRPYSFEDFTPEVAIIRFPDGWWGQDASWMPDTLYGAADLHAPEASRAWIGLWSLLTCGWTREDGISFHCRGYDDVSHGFFCPINNVAVYDHLVDGEMLEGVKLVFLTGVHVSPRSMECVEEFVRRGGVCVALRSLVPDNIVSGGRRVVGCGKGRWVLCEDFREPHVRREVAGYLPSPEEMRYAFGKWEVVFRKKGGDNEVEVWLRGDGEAKQVFGG